MEEKKTSNQFMMKLAAFIVNKRKAFIALFALACIYSAISISKVTVIDDLTKYLPETTETRQGLDIMDEEFTTFGSAKILVSNITYEKALALALNRLIEDRVLAERLGDEARRISERINEAAILEQWKEYIEEILG